MNRLLEYEQYMPHGMCLLWEPWLVILWAGSDLLIFLAYMMIPLALVLVLRKRPDIRHRGLVALFAAFILLCGITHAMSIVTLWTAIYPLMGTVKLATGLISMATAFMLFRLIPTAIRIPTPEKHEEVIEQLRGTLSELTRTRDELEQRVRDRTTDLKGANLRLAYIARDAVQRSRNLIQVVSSLTQPGVDASREPVSFLRELRGRINALTIATSTVMESSDRSTAQLERVIRRQIEPLFAKPAQSLQLEGPAVEVGAQGAQQISLTLWELASRHMNRPETGPQVPMIAVNWRIDTPSASDARLMLEWREKGRREEDSPLQLGSDLEEQYRPAELSEFAMVLLTRIVPKLLEGTGEVDMQDHSLVYRLECSLAALADASDGEDGADLVGNTVEGQLLAGL